MFTLPLLTLLATLPAAAATPPGAADQAVPFLILAGDEPAAQPVGPKVLTRVLAPDDANGAAPRMMFIHKDAGDIEPGGPWLGVQFGPVSRPLAAQLKLQKGIGQVVTNVIEGSPADQAGLQQYDVIVQIDGQDVAAEIGDFLAVVRGFQPGQAHALTLLREGQRITTSVTVGARPDGDEPPDYKYDTELEELSHGQILGRGGMLEKDDQGNWTFKGFNLKDLPDVWKAIPDVHDLDFAWSSRPFGDADHQVLVQKSKGKTIRLEREDDGQITVTTTTTVDGSESTTTKTYANEDELKAADPEAHKLLRGTHRFHFKIGGPDGPFSAEVQARIGEAMKNSEKVIEEMERTFGGHLGERAGPLLLRKTKAPTSFELNADGSIRVITRKGDEELVETYSNAEALRQARPDLHRKFERLQERAAPKPQN
jgi:hypothetical protein